MTADRYFEYPDNSSRAQCRVESNKRHLSAGLFRWKLLQRPKDNSGSEIGTATRQDNRRRKLLCREVTPAHRNLCMILPLYYTGIRLMRNIFSTIRYMHAQPGSFASFCCDSIPVKKTTKIFNAEN